MYTLHIYHTCDTLTVCLDLNGEISMSATTTLGQSFASILE